MKLKIVNFELAKLLKEKGFDWDDHNWYHEEMEHFLAPTQALVCKWLREVHGINIVIKPLYEGLFDYEISRFRESREDSFYYEGNPTIEMKGYEQAEEVAIEYCLKNLI